MSSDNNKPNKFAETPHPPIPYEVTSQGSLGLLALGAVGIKAWREKRAEEMKKSEIQQKNE